MKRTWITIVVIVIIIVLGLWIWSANNQTSSTQYESAPATTATSTTYSALEDTSSASATPMLTVATDPTLGTYLVATNGMTLYTYSPDKQNQSTCTGGCATAWPPYAVSGTLAAGNGANGALGLYTRADGSTQLTYNGMPLYYYAKDMKPGDTTGEGVGGVWYVATP